MSQMTFYGVIYVLCRVNAKFILFNVCMNWFVGKLACPLGIYKAVYQSNLIIYVLKGEQTSGEWCTCKLTRLVFYVNLNTVTSWHTSRQHVIKRISDFSCCFHPKQHIFFKMYCNILEFQGVASWAKSRWVISCTTKNNSRSVCTLYKHWLISKWPQHQTNCDGS